MAQGIKGSLSPKSFQYIEDALFAKVRINITKQHKNFLDKVFNSQWKITTIDSDNNATIYKFSFFWVLRWYTRINEYKTISEIIAMVKRNFEGVSNV